MLKCRTEINEEALKVLRRISLYRGRNVKIAVAAVTGFMALDFHTIAWQMHSVKVMVLAVLCAVVCLVTVMSLSGLIVAMRTRLADRSLTSGWRVYHIDGSGIGYESPLGMGHDGWNAYREWGECGHYFWLRNAARQFVLIDADGMQADEPARLRMLLEDRIGRGVMIMGFKERLDALSGRKKSFDWFAVGVIDGVECGRENAVEISGNLRGTLHEGDRVSVRIMYDDRKAEVIESVVTELRSIDRKKNADEVTDERVSFVLEGVSPEKAVSGVVVHSKNVSEEMVWEQHCMGLIDNCLLLHRMNLDERTLARLSVSDCTLLWQSLNDMKQRGAGGSDGEYQRVVHELGGVLTGKLVGLDCIYCLFSTITGEPAMFSQTSYDGATGTATTPDILAMTRPYYERERKSYSADRFEFRKVANGPEKDGIIRFLSDCFFLNGAGGVRINDLNLSVARDMLIEERDYSGFTEEKIPVTNPGVVRWLLLLEQIGSPETEQEHRDYGLYFAFLARALNDAMLIVPVRYDDVRDVDVNGMLKDGSSFDIPVMPGVSPERDVIRIYTDRGHLQEGMAGSGEWNGMLQNVESIIGTYDCVINLTNCPGSGYYITDRAFASMKQIVEMSRNEQQGGR